MSRSGQGGSQPRGNADRPEFEKLYEAHGDLVYAKAMTILRNHSLAADAAQETWLRVVRALDKGFRPDNPQAWLFTIAGREARRILGRLRTQKPVDEVEMPSHDGDADIRENRKQLDAALSRIPHSDRELLWQRYMEERPHRELQRMYGLSRSGLWGRIRAALERLRRAFTDE